MTRGICVGEEESKNKNGIVRLRGPYGIDVVSWWSSAFSVRNKSFKKARDAYPIADHRTLANPPDEIAGYACSKISADAIEDESETNDETCLKRHEFWRFNSKQW